MASIEDLPVYRLADVLASLPMPVDSATCSRKWRCRLAPLVPDVTADEVSLLSYLHQGMPCFLPQSRGQRVHEAAPDAKKFVTDPRWNRFPKPKIAFVGGWAAPGTDMENAELHLMVNSFGDMYKDYGSKSGNEEGDAKSESTQHHNWSGNVGRAAPPQEAAEPPSSAVEPSNESGAPVGRQDAAKVLNLQFFHRSDPASHPPIPNLSTLLDWPPLLSEDQGGVVCDNATRVSQAGAVTWWHLDDSGEFVMQTGLPEENPQSVCPRERPPASAELAQQFASQSYHLPTVKHPAVKVFLYAPHSSYDWIIHDHGVDKEENRTSSLQIFTTADDELPPEEYLPIITVAVLQAGGHPLLSPPNIPHLVVTVRDCVMVEQRRISRLFLDEVAYLLVKTQHWDRNPIIYSYVRDELQDVAHLRSVVVRQLLEHAKDAIENDRHHFTLAALKLQRCLLSLASICLYSFVFFKLDSTEAAAKESAASLKASLVQLLREFSARWHTPAVIRSSLGSAAAASAAVADIQPVTVDEVFELLREYFDVNRAWVPPAAATHVFKILPPWSFLPPTLLWSRSTGVRRKAPSEAEARHAVDGESQKSAVGDDGDKVGPSAASPTAVHWSYYCAVAMKNFSPVYGPLRAAAVTAAHDLPRLQAAVDGGAAEAVAAVAQPRAPTLAVQKDILDELF